MDYSTGSSSYSYFDMPISINTVGTNEVYYYEPTTALDLKNDIKKLQQENEQIKRHNYACDSYLLMLQKIRKVNI
jgi:hypothetical protein